MWEDHARVEAICLPVVHKLGEAHVGRGITLEPEVLAPPFTIFDTKQEAWISPRTTWFRLHPNTEEWRNICANDTVDPCVVELLLRWYSPKAAVVIDCFSASPLV